MDSVEDRKYVVFSASEVGSVDFSQVMETSADTCRYSVDGSKTFVKYTGDMPSTVASLVTKSGEYTHGEMLDLMVTAEWAAPLDESMYGNP